MDLNRYIETVKEELTKRNLTTSFKHFNQIELLIKQRNWESANGQIRTFLESLFNDVCQIVLKENKTGGASRKALHSAGLIDEEQAEFIKGFMKLAHTKGAHPGLSNEMETISRWYACLSLTILGISLFPKVIKASDVLTMGGIKIQSVDRITDELISCACPTCEERQIITLCSIYMEGDETRYKCKNGCQDILVISKPLKTPVEGRGYLIKKYVLRNAGDLYILIPFSGRFLLIPKSPAALKRL